MEIRFKDNEHKSRYNEICSRMKKNDGYNLSLAYLFALSKDLTNNIDALFDFTYQIIKPDGIGGWLTGSSRRTLYLAYELFTGSKEWYEDVDVDKDDVNISYIFEYTDQEYYFEAIRIRYNLI